VNLSTIVVSLIYILYSWSLTRYVGKFKYKKSTMRLDVVNQL